MACTPWPGQYPNPLQYQSACGYIDDFCARPLGSSCEQWAAHCDVVAAQTFLECPPVGDLRAAMLGFDVAIERNGAAWMKKQVAKTVKVRRPRPCGCR